MTLKLHSDSNSEIRYCNIESINENLVLVFADNGISYEEIFNYIKSSFNILEVEYSNVLVNEKTYELLLKNFEHEKGYQDSIDEMPSEFRKHFMLSSKKLRQYLYQDIKYLDDINTNIKEKVLIINCWGHIVCSEIINKIVSLNQEYRKIIFVCNELFLTSMDYYTLCFSCELSIKEEFLNLIENEIIEHPDNNYLISYQRKLREFQPFEQKLKISFQKYFQCFFTIYNMKQAIDLIKQNNNADVRTLYINDFNYLRFELHQSNFYVNEKFDLYFSIIILLINNFNELDLSRLNPEKIDLIKIESFINSISKISKYFKFKKVDNRYKVLNKKVFAFLKYLYCRKAKKTFSVSSHNDSIHMLHFLTSREFKNISNTILQQERDNFYEIFKKLGFHTVNRIPIKFQFQNEAQEYILEKI